MDHVALAAAEEEVVAVAAVQRAAGVVIAQDIVEPAALEDLDRRVAVAARIAPVGGELAEVDHDAGIRVLVGRRVLARAAAQRVRPATADQDVIAVPAVEKIGPRIADQRVALVAPLQVLELLTGRQHGRRAVVGDRPNLDHVGLLGAQPGDRQLEVAQTEGRQCQIARVDGGEQAAVLVDLETLDVRLTDAGIEKGVAEIARIQNDGGAVIVQEVVDQVEVRFARACADAEGLDLDPEVEKLLHRNGVARAGGRKAIGQEVHDLLAAFRAREVGIGRFQRVGVVGVAGIGQAAHRFDDVLHSVAILVGPGPKGDRRAGVGFERDHGDVHVG